MHRRGILAARSNLAVARRAAERYLAERSEPDPNKLDLMIYYGSFFSFSRSALSALESSDGRLSPELTSIQRAFFLTSIKDDPVFGLLKSERDRIGHGDDSWAVHPMMPLSMINRFVAAGHDWSVAVFDNVWPDEPFRGQSIEAVLNAVWRKVSGWLDEIDRRDDQRHRAKNGN